MDRPGMRDWAVTLLRAVAGLLLMQHGMQKPFGWLPGLLLFCFIFLFFAARGAGPVSLDAFRARARPT